jgi:uncharacterized protein (TIGR02452 family)
MASRERRAAIAQETLQVLSAGAYIGPSGRAVPINTERQSSINGTRLFRPGELGKLAAVAPAPRGRPRIRVINGTTRSAARRLHESHGPERVDLLNVASARNPGAASFRGARPWRRASPGHRASMRRSAG